MDIHDQTLADLATVKRKLEQMRDEAPGQQEVSKIEADLQRAMTNLRVVMDNLHPQTLDILGLPAAVESLLGEQRCRQLSELLANLEEYGSADLIELIAAAPHGGSQKQTDLPDAAGLKPHGGTVGAP